MDYSEAHVSSFDHSDALCDSAEEAASTEAIDRWCGRFRASPERARWKSRTLI